MYSQIISLSPLKTVIYVGDCILAPVLQTDHEMKLQSIHQWWLRKQGSLCWLVYYREKKRTIPSISH